MREPQYYTRSILAQLLPKYCTGLVLDAGAGRAKYKEMILPYCRRYIAIDNMSSLYQFDGFSNLRLDVIADILQMPFCSNVFDTIICTQVIEHIPQPHVLVGELARVLKPCGHLILSTGWCSPYHPEPNDFYRFSADGLTYLLKVADLQVVEIIPQGGALSAMLYWCSRLIELHKPAVHKLISKTRVLRMVELLVEFLEQKVFAGLTHYDAIGYTVVGRK